MTQTIESLANMFLSDRNATVLTNKQAAWLRDIIRRELKGEYRDENIYCGSVTVKPRKLGALNSFEIVRENR